MDKSSTGLQPNVAGLLCYLAGWITGLVFFLIEKESKFVKFHALQSLITFGFLSVVSVVLSWIPFLGWVLGWVVGIISIVFWILLMVKAYQGQMYKVPWAGNIAESQLK